ncbi:MAG: hypothetical protein ACM3II_04975 [Rhodospirillaceae bacterium]
MLHLPPETFARYQVLRGNTPARNANGTMQAVVADPGISTSVGPTADPALSSYSLQGVYFNPQQFDSVADCLTAASSHGLPLDLCQ